MNPFTRTVLAPLAAVLALVPAAAAHAALPAPKLDAPLAAATSQSVPTFSWRAVKAAAEYEFQLSADAKFGSIVLGRGKGTGLQRTRNTAATLTKTLPDGRYFWRVRAISRPAKAGRWATPRQFTRAWTAKASLVSPAEGATVEWPKSPLVLRWSPVLNATHYLVTVASDASLAQTVIGGPNKPTETQATVFALKTTLPAGEYFWQITPVDAGGQRGTPSAVGRFSWAWPTATATRFTDLNPSVAVTDPLLDWGAVPGAARYEVEINPDDDFSAGSRVCCRDRVVGTSISPLRLLPNNDDFAGSSGYHWRVRAFDANGTPGRWNVGPAFEKGYDEVAPTVPGVAVETVPTADAATASPLVTWDAVPGAAQYQVQWTTHVGGVCGWSNASGPVKTSALAWTPLSPTAPSGVPGGIGITVNMRPNGPTARSGQPFGPERAYATGVTPFVDGTAYCVRVRALSDDSFRENDNATSQVLSQWTQAGGGGENTPAFTYGAPPTAASDPAMATPLDPPTYLSPVTTTVARTPVLRWQPVAGARRYFVLVARDSNFTNVIDAAFTAMPAYAPNLALEDEQSSYFWAVVPASQSDGSGISGGPKAYNPQRFAKLSVPPVLGAPVTGEAVATQPTFRWAAVDGAQKYRVQVSADPEFGDLLDDVVTAATAYTSQTPYPADAALYWRVRAEQLQVLQGGERVELRWSATGSFRRVLERPTLAPGNDKVGELIPVLAWSPVAGAVSYDLHVDEADGDAKDFTIPAAAFAPVKFFGTGIFRFKVRANFATTAGSVASGYLEGSSFTRIISPPPSPRLVRTESRLLFGWGTAAAGGSYRVEVSQTDSFAKLVDSVTTDNVSWAPDLSRAELRARGALYWRVATVDEGNNYGAFVTNRIPARKTLKVKLKGVLKQGRRAKVVVTVTDANTRKAIVGATVAVTGAGVASPSRRTIKGGRTTLTLRPRKAGAVLFAVTRPGYPTAVVKMRAR